MEKKYFIKTKNDEFVSNKTYLMTVVLPHLKKDEEITIISLNEKQV